MNDIRTEFAQFRGLVKEFLALEMNADALIFSKEYDQIVERREKMLIRLQMLCEAYDFPKVMSMIA